MMAPLPKWSISSTNSDFESVNIVVRSLIRDPCLDHVLHAQQVHLWMGNWIVRSLLSCRVQILLRSLKKLHWICRTEVQQVSKVFVDRDIVEGGYCWISLNLSSSYFSLHVHWICLAIALRVWSAAKTDVWLGFKRVTVSSILFLICFKVAILRAYELNH